MCSLRSRRPPLQRCGSLLSSSKRGYACEHPSHPNLIFPLLSYDDADAGEPTLRPITSVPAPPMPGMAGKEPGMLSV